MCRIDVLNSTCGDSYLKNWIIFDACTRIFSKRLKEEVVLLHRQNCIDDVKRCSDMLLYYDNDISHITDFFSDGEINWKALASMLILIEETQRRYKNNKITYMYSKSILYLLYWILISFSSFMGLRLCNNKSFSLI